MNSPALSSLPALDPAREQAILRATLDVLADSGYEALRMDTVAARAKASKATLYRHWSGKPDLVACAIRSYERLDDLVRETDTGSLRGDMLAILRAMAETMTGPTGRIMMGVMVAMQHDPHLAEAVRTSIIDSRQHIIQGMFDRALVRGELSAHADASVFDEIAPAVLFTQIFILGRQVRQSDLLRLADDIVLPLLTPR